MKKLNYNMLLGLFVISFGVFLQVLWLIVCFSTIFIGVLLLLFAPHILFFPFNLFFALGMKMLGDEFRSKSNNKYYRYNFKYRHHHNYNNEKRQYDYSHIKTKYENIDEYYAILNSKPSDSFETIKKNYRNLIKQYHYDTLASKGLSKEELKQAEEMTKKINDAYSKVKEKLKR